MNDTKLNTGHNRIVYLDILRITATLAVMMLHISGHSWDDIEVTSAEWSILNFYDSISRWGVPVFVMISGALFLSRYRPVKAIYSKNILRIVTAFIFWSAFYAGLKYLNDHDAKAFALNFIKGHFHMWFLFMIVGLYMIVPLLRPITEDTKMCRYFIVLGILFTSLIPLCIKVTAVFRPGYAGHLQQLINSIDIHMVVGYSVYFVIGYYLHKVLSVPVSGKSGISGKLLYTAIVMGIIGFVSTVLLTAWISVRTGAPNEMFFSYLSFNVLLEAVSVFILVYAVVSRIAFGERAKAIIAALADYSFGAFLVHPYIISIVRNKAGLDALTFNPVISALLMLLIVAAASFVVSAAIHKVPVAKKYIV